MLEVIDDGVLYKFALFISVIIIIMVIIIMGALLTFLVAWLYLPCMEDFQRSFAIHNMCISVVFYLCNS